MKPLWIAVICLVSFAAHAAEFPTGPIQQIGTTNQQTSAWERDKWQPSKRWNKINVNTGLRDGGFIQRDTWEPSKRFNVYDSNGQYKGKLQRDTWQSDRYNYTPSSDGIGEYDSGIPEYNDGLQ